MSGFKDDFHLKWFFSPRDQVFVKLNPYSLPAPAAETSGLF